MIAIHLPVLSSTLLDHHVEWFNWMPYSGGTDGIVEDSFRVEWTGTFECNESAVLLFKPVIKRISGRIEYGAHSLSVDYDASRASAQLAHRSVARSLILDDAPWRMVQPSIVHFTMPMKPNWLSIDVSERSLSVRFS